MQKLFFVLHVYRLKQEKTKFQVQIEHTSPDLAQHMCLKHSHFMVIEHSIVTRYN